MVETNMRTAMSASAAASRTVASTATAAMRPRRLAMGARSLATTVASSVVTAPSGARISTVSIAAARPYTGQAIADTATAAATPSPTRSVARLMARSGNRCPRPSR